MARRKPRPEREREEMALLELIISMHITPFYIFEGVYFWEVRSTKESVNVKALLKKGYLEEVNKPIAFAEKYAVPTDLGKKVLTEYRNRL